MTLQELKTHLINQKTISFKLPDGRLVPNHFHVTEVGKVSKHFIDCGGTVRQEVKANLQLWSADDYDHRLHPEKLIKIIDISQDKIGLHDEEIEVEYQGTSIMKFGLEFDGDSFLLSTKQTDCLAKDNCGVPEDKSLQLETVNNNSCEPGSGCC